MTEKIDKERAIRVAVRMAIEAYASGFSDRHISEDEDFAVEKTFSYSNHIGDGSQRLLADMDLMSCYFANLFEKMAITIAHLSYDVTQNVEGPIYQEQTDYIAELLKLYKNIKGENHKQPEVRDFWNFVCKSERGYDIVIDEYKKNAYLLMDVLNKVCKPNFLQNRLIVGYE